MLELELQQYLLRKYPQENASCEWKELKKRKARLKYNKRKLWHSQQHKRLAQQADDRIHPL